MKKINLRKFLRVQSEKALQIKLTVKDFVAFQPGDSTTNQMEYLPLLINFF